MASPRCHQPPVTALPTAVRVPAAAAELFDHLLAPVDPGTGPRSAGLLIEPWSGHPVTAMHRAGVVGGADLVELCAVCADAGEHPVDHPGGPELLLVLATWQPGAGVAPTDAHRACWGAMLTTTAGSAVHLVDWLLIDGDGIASVATVLGRRPRW